MRSLAPTAMIRPPPIATAPSRNMRRSLWVRPRAGAADAPAHVISSDAPVIRSSACMARCYLIGGGAIGRRFEPPGYW